MKCKKLLQKRSNPSGGNKTKITLKNKNIVSNHLNQRLNVFFEKKKLLLTYVWKRLNRQTSHFYKCSGKQTGTIVIQIN